MEITEQAIRIRGKTLKLNQEGTILVYDKENKAYKPMSYAEIFALFDSKQNEALKELERQNEGLLAEKSALEKELADYKAEMNGKFDSLLADTQEWQANFIKKYQDSMSTLTQLVKAAIKE